MRLETLCVHGGHDPDAATGAVTPPIHLSTTFERDEDGGYSRGYRYAREGNPTRRALEQALASIEGGTTALAFSSGQAAINAVFQALAPGDHVVIPDNVYHGTPKLLREVFGGWGLAYDAVDMGDLAAVRAAMRPSTRILWVETPSNPLLAVTDIAAVSTIAREAGVRTIVDNTWGTPVAQRPLELGADLVMHATTKYLGGHSDVLGGTLIAKADDDFVARLRLVQTTAGAVAAPFDCWLVLRGLRSLAWRFRGQVQNASTVVAFLDAHARVDRVFYPGLATHPGHEIARRQMSLFGAMASFQVRGGRDAAMRVASRVKVFTRATSLGGVESLIEHRQSIEGPDSRTPADLLRISVGLEHPEDLVRDLEQALG